MIAILQHRIAELQAKIDRLMLEHCPDEMTAEQVENWGRHQAASNDLSEHDAKALEQVAQLIIGQVSHSEAANYYLAAAANTLQSMVDAKRLTK